MTSSIHAIIRNTLCEDIVEKIYRFAHESSFKAVMIDICTHKPLVERIVQAENPLIVANEHGCDILQDMYVFDCQTLMIKVSNIHFIIWHYYFDTPMYGGNRILVEAFLDGNKLKVERFSQIQCTPPSIIGPYFTTDKFEMISYAIDSLVDSIHGTPLYTAELDKSYEGFGEWDKPHESWSKFDRALNGNGV